MVTSDSFEFNADCRPLISVFLCSYGFSEFSRFNEGYSLAPKIKFKDMSVTKKSRVFINSIFYEK